MKPYFLASIAIAAVTLAACASNDDPYYKTKISTPNIVAGCKYIGNISSSSQNYGFFNETANEQRIKNAKKSGYNLGATDIVLDPAIENGNTTITNGKAYVCPGN
ncbi:MAG: hypothetical protein DI586_02250 [Micavibrio aeruginosavorus]|uniref:DUF4156 domain-containing protein n=1 Tax=Micavibrio aeruginosavorus TaxID=349221 RepID=A0A2W5FSR7_9BACT|nr:MAG: hypothetical protein DI586_02250 [Micavibrio aeruginosavorus]